jgi:hypothetical protein
MALREGVSPGGIRQYTERMYAAYTAGFLHARGWLVQSCAMHVPLACRQALTSVDRSTPLRSAPPAEAAVTSVISAGRIAARMRDCHWRIWCADRTCNPDSYGTAYRLGMRAMLGARALWWSTSTLSLKTRACATQCSAVSVH